MTLELVAMTDAQIAEYLPVARAGYVTDLVRAGSLNQARAEAKAERDYASLDTNEATIYVAAYADVDDVRTMIGVAGYGIAGFNEPHDEPHLFVFDLEVFDDFRRRGFATEILRQLCEVARAEHCVCVRLTVWAGNDGAHDLYLKFGFAPESHHLKMVI